MTDAIGLLTDELKTALQHVSGKRIDGTYQTTAEMLHAFNELYICNTVFDVVDSSSLVALENAVVTVKSGDVVLEPGENGRYALEAGTYTYSCTCEGYTDIVETSVTISASDVTRGSKSVTVKMTATE